MKKTQLLLIGIGSLAALALTSCAKRCACYKYDGTTTYYTQEEVSARDVSCSDMIYLDHLRYFSLCEWTHRDEN